MEKQFSFQSREKSLQRFQNEVFDLLIIGGGITGAAVARDATSRGLSVALVERKDFAYGTSSRSSKLIHGGLRYLENLEFGLVFEALSERTLLLKTVPHMVRPLPFYWPVYQKEKNGRGILSLGLWLYDFLALFRSPGFHRSLSRKQLLKEIPILKSEGLKGGFRYFDASMWDDVLAVETLRSAADGGAAIANYVEALCPIWEGSLISGFQVQDLAKGLRSEGQSRESSVIHLKAKRTVVCAGPWTDEVGASLSKNWSPWLNPSKGVHLIFDSKRIPIPGAMVMNHPEDGRISFVIPRPDYGSGVVIVGTTDGPSGLDPEKADIGLEDVQYLLKLLNQYFPTLKLTPSDILSAYVGVRPLVGNLVAQNNGKRDEQKNPLSSDLPDSRTLQKVSREHHIGEGPGGTVVVAGGKYTTHRKMAEEIVDFTLKKWKEDSLKNSHLNYPSNLKPSNTRVPVNSRVSPEAIAESRLEFQNQNIEIPAELLGRYGAEMSDLLQIQGKMQGQIGGKSKKSLEDPVGFSWLETQLRHAMRTQMVLFLEDFYFRRTPLFAARMDHGLPWAEKLAQVWAEERGLDQEESKFELQRLKTEIAARMQWKTESIL